MTTASVPHSPLATDLGKPQRKYIVEPQQILVPQPVHEPAPATPEPVPVEPELEPA